ncbi:MAG: DUF3048 domain-containing protein [Kribbellaceae bacterium]
MRSSGLVSTTRGRVGLAAALVAVIVVAMVGGYAFRRGDRAGSPGGTPEATPAGTAPQADGAVSMDGRAPLTGLPTDQPLDRPAVTVKVSNSPDAHPHRGLADADIVVVEPITGATTRLAAIFHSWLPEQVGPVRSLRPMDAPLIGPTGGVIANTMADRWVQQYVDEVADLANLGTLRVPRAYRIDSSRRAPNHVFAQPARLLELTDRAAPPEPYFSYAADAGRSTAQRSGRAAESVTVGYGGTATTTWRYDHGSGRWLRLEKWSAHRLEDGRQISAQNVIVLRAQRDTSFTQAKASMTILDFIDAAGWLQLFTGDKVISGRWSKGGVNEPFTFTTTDGRPLLLAPGTTWVECALTGMSVRVGPQT